MDRKAIDAICTEVDFLYDEMVSVLQELVRIPSVTGEEGPAQAFMKTQYEALGLEVHSLEADRSRVVEHITYCDSGHPFKDRPNIIGIKKGDPRKQSIILNGHVDVVSAEPLKQWKHDPWGAEIENGRLYGRGALDMKAGLISNLFALKALLQADLEPMGSVMLQSVIEEEHGGGGGALACFLEGYTADGMIVSEPAPWVTVSLAGIIRCTIKVQGKSAHPSQSHLGVNAIGKILPLYKALEQLDLRRKAEVHFPLFEQNGAPSCHLIVGTLHGGEWIASVAGAAEMGCRIGFIPGEKTDDIRKMIETLVADIAHQDEWLRDHPPLIEWHPFQAEPHYQDPDHPFVQTVISALSHVQNPVTPVKPHGVTWTEDTRLAQHFGVPALSFGPCGERPHGIDECVTLESLKSAAKAAALAAYQWCLGDKS
ncbi:ArgE/DapE family deacylase [bacterium]|nr:ArgE/DapE family deacylase [bacterium]